MKAILLPTPSLRGSRIHLFDDLCKWLPDFLIVLQGAHQPLLGLFVGSLGLLTLNLSCDRADIVALLGPPLVVPVQ